MRLFDGHCDTLLRCYETGQSLRQNPGQVDLQRGRQLEAYAQFFAIFGDETTTPGLPLYTLFQKQHQIFATELAKNADVAVQCRTAEEGQAANAGGKIACFLSVEGGELLDCDTDKLKIAYDLGVRAVNITWNHPNLLSGTNAEERDRGLSPQGRDFVREMGRLGMLVDVSHLSDPGFWDVAELVEGPFFASHSNSRNICPDPRNLTDAQFTAIIEHQGVAGLNLYAAFLGENATVDTIVAHLEHFLALGGEHNVAIGGDWDGCSQLPQGFSDICSLEKLQERLLQRNYSQTLIEALFYNNMMRVVKSVCTM
ncbi:MAG: dipeptidase [Oscillospiraceae bacterium]